MTFFFKTYRFINNTSLDVVAGAISSALFFARIMHVTSLPQGIISLGLSVWIIYTTDHLLDARRIKQLASTERHRFHQNNFFILSVLLLLALLADVAIIFYMRAAVFNAGLLLGHAKPSLARRASENSSSHQLKFGQHDRRPQDIFDSLLGQFITERRQEGLEFLWRRVAAEGVLPKLLREVLRRVPRASQQSSRSAIHVVRQRLTV